MELYVYFISAIPVFLPEASSEVSNQFPDKGEEGIIIGILGNLQVSIHQGAEVIGEELREDVVGEELPQVQAILQKEADKLGSVLYKSCKHDFLKVSGLRRKSRERTHTLNPIKEASHFLPQLTSHFQPQSNRIIRFSFSSALEIKFIFSVVTQCWILAQALRQEKEAAWWDLNSARRGFGWDLALCYGKVETMAPCGMTLTKN